ncbi:MAG: toll/interleukin-1 receptor domain-containing protein, partial [Planctomycetes bacterium]|nr:toll/interleukin-1 receptor domain-containing protein [Planctomycetota bacterium]
MLIFVSYPREDGTPTARLIEERLRAAGHDVFVDTSRVIGGVEWDRQVVAAIRDCGAMVAVITASTYESHFCRVEQLRALKLRKRIVPVLVHVGAMIPLHLEGLQYRDFSMVATLDDAIAALLRDLDHAAATPEPAPRATPVLAPDLPADFAPRPDALADLRQLLVAGDHSALRVLHGEPGSGRTTLALAACRDPVVQAAFPDGVVLTRVDERPFRLRTACAAALDRLVAEPPPESLEAFWSRLQPARVLWILDEAVDTGAWCRRLANVNGWGARPARALVVGRAGPIAAGVPCLSIPEPDADFTQRLFASIAGCAEPVPGWLVASPGPAALAAASLRAGTPTSHWRREPGRAEGAFATAIAVALAALDPGDRRLMASLPVFPSAARIPLALLVEWWRRLAKAGTTGSDGALDTAIARLIARRLLELIDTEHVRLPAEVGMALGPASPVLCEQFVDALADGSPRSVSDRPAVAAYRRAWLPAHLVAAARHDELAELAMRADWLRDQLDATDLDTLLEDLERLGPSPPLLSLADALRSARGAIERQPAQLSSQLVGRLPRVGAFVGLLETVESLATGAWLRPRLRSLQPPAHGRVARLCASDFDRLATLSADGRRVLVVRRSDQSGKDDRVECREAVSGELISELRGHRGSIG